MDLLAGRPPPAFDGARRSTQTEVLDGAVPTAELSRILRDLARFNGIMSGHRPILRWLDEATEGLDRNRSLTFLDVGCGYGDLLRAVRRWARKRGRIVRLLGLDLSPQVIEVARGVSQGGDIEFIASDVFDFVPREPVDFVASSLVTHHLPGETIVRFVRWMETAARRGWIVYDLQRSIVPYYFIALAGPVLRLHPVVTYDGRISVARSLTRAEWMALLDAAQLPPGAARLRWFLFRHVIGRLK